LNDQPVEARPPSVGYRLRKFMRRHKGPVLTASALLVALLACVVGTTIGLTRALAAERLASQRLQRAEQAEVEATKERNTAVAAEAKASREAAIARAVTAFLQTDLLEMAGVWAQFSSDLPPDPDVKLRTLLNRAERRVGERFRDQPEVEAAIRA